jgi:hypothetical protein
MTPGMNIVMRTLNRSLFRVVYFIFYRCLRKCTYRRVAEEETLGAVLQGISIPEEENGSSAVLPLGR